MKTAFLMAVCLFFEASNVAAGLVMKGGIVYYVHVGAACPGFELVRNASNRFSIKKRVGIICPMEFPVRQAEFTFVLGALEPGPVRISVEGDLGSPMEFQVTVLPSDEQTIANQRTDASGRLSFHINGYGSARYVIQKTTDFENWIDATTRVGDSDFTESESAGELPFFYRVKILEPAPVILPQ